MRRIAKRVWFGVVVGYRVSNHHAKTRIALILLGVNEFNAYIHEVEWEFFSQFGRAARKM